MTNPPPDLARLYDEHAQALYAFLLSFTGQEADARDLLQEVFVKVALQPQAFARAQHERAFLLQTSYRLGLDWSRRRQVRRQREDLFQPLAEDALFAPAADPDISTFRAALGAALLHLAVEQRAVVSLKLWQGLTFQQIAEVLDLSPHTAASRYRYALDKLRGQLRPIYEEIR